MDYLFFDMECADGNRICSFGYVLTNEHFDILEKRDILINPECGFQLGRHGEEPYIKLAYPEKQFKKAPNFSALFSAVRDLLTAQDRILFGHSIASDLGFLERACTRYNLPQLNLTVFDTQSMYSFLTEPGAQMRSLEYIAADLQIDVSHLTEHKSCDDAEMSMLAAKALCNRLHCTVADLLRRTQSCTVSSGSLAVGRALKELRARYRKSKKAPAFCLSDAITLHDANKRINLLRAIFFRGYGYSNTVQKCAYFVSNGAPCAKERAYSDLAAQGAAVRKITLTELGNMLGVAVDEHGETADALQGTSGLSAKAAFDSAAPQSAAPSKSRTAR